MEPQNRIAGVFAATPRTIQWRNTLERFGLRAQLLHLVIGCAVVIMLIWGLTVDAWPKKWEDAVVAGHKAVGLWILLLGVIWIGHYLWQPTPIPLPGQTRPLYRLAKLTHKLLLICVIAMPLSGWIMVSAWGDHAIAMLPFLHVPAIAKNDPAFAKAMFGVHILVAWIIGGLLALHVAGAFYHHIIKRDPILKRMIPRFRAPNGYYRFQFDRARAAAKKLK